MGMTTVVRRGASRVVPLAARSFQGNPGSSYHSSALFATVNPLRTTDLGSVLFKPSLPAPLRSFYSEPDPDNHLLRILMEYEYYNDPNANMGMFEVFPEVFPRDFPFKIEDLPGKRFVTLTREYEDKQITVHVHMPSFVTGDYHDKLERSDDQLPLVVRISKNQGLCVEFACTAMPWEIFIDRLSVKNPNRSQIIAYKGPDFDELDENLQKGCHKYLEMNGIKPSTAYFLLKYMLRKDRRENSVWLKNVKKFLEL